MRAYRTEVKLNKEQEQLYKLCIAAQRFVWNLFIEENEKSKKYINDYNFSKWLNNVYLKENEEKSWIKKAGSKALSHTLRKCHQTYVKAFKAKRGFPKKKNCKTFNEGYYFVRNSLNTPIKVERHKIKVPMFGWVTLKEKGYLPLEGIISGTIKKRADRYFISVITEENPIIFQNNSGEGVGVDLGVKEFMTCSNGFVFPNIIKSPKIIKLEKKLRREQRALSRKYEAHKKDKELTYKNFEKNKLRVQKLNYRLECKRNDYINKCIEIIVEQKPKFITLENLNIKGMVKNKHLAKAIRDSKFYYTKQKIIEKAKKNGIEVREVERFYPSSKICSKCGKLKKDLKLKDRTYKCSCGLEIDRDLNAALNLKKAKEYKVLTETTDGLSGSNDCEVLYQTAVAIQPLIESEAEHGEAVRSHFILMNTIEPKRNLLIKRYNSVLGKCI